jgi:3-hydroxybutyryl-CoA dehydratase
MEALMSHPLSYDELQVGDRWRSQARTVTEADVVNFACLTGDFDPLHVDHETARQSPFGRPIAHGLLGLSFTAGLGLHSPWAATVAFVGIREWRFIKPLFIGDTVHVVTEVLEKEPRGRRQGAITWKRQLCNQEGQIVQEGIFETLVAMGHAVTHKIGKLSTQPSEAVRVA